MKLYVDYKKSEGVTKLGFTLYSKTGSILYTDVQNISKEENKNILTLKALIFGITRVQQLQGAGTLPNDNLTIFIKNKIIYNWFATQKPSKEYEILFDEIAHKLDWMEVPMELIHVTNMNGKVKYKGMHKEEKTYSIQDLL